MRYIVGRFSVLHIGLGLGLGKGRRGTQETRVVMEYEAGNRDRRHTYPRHGDEDGNGSEDGNRDGMATDVDMEITATTSDGPILVHFQLPRRLTLPRVCYVSTYFKLLHFVAVFRAVTCVAVGCCRNLMLSVFLSGQGMGCLDSPPVISDLLLLSTSTLHYLCVHVIRHLPEYAQHGSSTSSSF